MADVQQAEVIADAGPTLLTSRAAPQERGVKQDETLKGPPDALEVNEREALEEEAARACAAEDELAAQVLAVPAEGVQERQAASKLAPVEALEVAADELAEDSDDAEDDEEGEVQDLSPRAQEARLAAWVAAQEKAARDESFWTAAQQALHERERRERVGAFLKEHGFQTVNSKQGWWNYTYPLHVASELGDARLVQLMLDSKATRRRKNSAGQTARQLAKSLNVGGSHDAVVEVLKFSQRRLRRQAPGHAPAAKMPSIKVASPGGAAPPVAESKEVVPKTSTIPCVMSPNAPFATVFGHQDTE